MDSLGGPCGSQIISEDFLSLPSSHLGFQEPAPRAPGDWGESSLEIPEMDLHPGSSCVPELTLAAPAADTGDPTGWISPPVTSGTNPLGPTIRSTGHRDPVD